MGLVLLAGNLAGKMGKMDDKLEPTNSLQNSQPPFPKKQRIFRKLQERVKELTALHRASRLLQKSTKNLRTTLARLVKILPAAWQFPAIASARIRYGNYTCATENFTITQWMQTS